jgi:hypothetical protein
LICLKKEIVHIHEILIKRYLNKSFPRVRYFSIYIYLEMITSLLISCGNKCVIRVSRISAINFRYSSDDFVPCA